MSDITTNHVIEKALVLKDTLKAQKVILESLDYQLNEVLLSINTQDLLQYTDEFISPKTPNYKRN